MRRKRDLRAHLWRSLFDPLYIPRPLFVLFIDPLVVGVVFATVLGVLLGWEGVALGALFGVFLAGAYGARILLVRWVIRKRGGK